MSAKWLNPGAAPTLYPLEVHEVHLLLRVDGAADGGYRCEPAGALSLADELAAMLLAVT